jgi:Ca-activated chloride channel family protein
VANIGVTGPDAILEEVRHYVEESVTLTTIGFGMDNYNDVLMEQLADNGDGLYAYVDDLREARRLFIDQITGTLQTIAMDANVQVDFNAEVVMLYRLVGFENRAIADEQFAITR